MITPFHVRPELLGFPHRVCSPQITEPFWSQLSSLAITGGNTQDERASTDTQGLISIDEAMDDRPLIIDHGEKSMFGKKDKIKGTGRPSPSTADKKPREMVGVYASDTFIKTAPLLLLVRFSKAAARAFPKPATLGDLSTVMTSAPSIKATNCHPSMASNSESDKIELRLSSSQASPSSHNKSSPKKPNDRRLFLNLAGVAKPPPASAISSCLNWMHRSKGIRKGGTLQTFEFPACAPLSTLTDLYAAVLCFDLRPFPNDLRNVIMDRLSAERPLAYELEYIYEHVPLKDGVVTRAITAYYEHREEDLYTALENAAIHQYVESNPRLLDRFIEIENTRWARAHRGQNDSSRDNVLDHIEDEKRNAEKGIGGPARTGRKRDRRKQQNKNNQRRAAGPEQTGTETYAEDEKWVQVESSTGG